MADAIIRTARKAGRCANYSAWKAGNAPTCHGIINRDDRYEQGDPDPYLAGGFGHDRICAGCSEAVKTERAEHVLGKNCHVCGQQHGTAHYFRVCAPRHKKETAHD